jgi:hypothetical protein
VTLAECLNSFQFRLLWLMLLWTFWCVLLGEPWLHSWWCGAAASQSICMLTVLQSPKVAGHIGTATSTVCRRENSIPACSVRSNVHWLSRAMRWISSSPKMFICWGPGCQCLWMGLWRLCLRRGH